MTDQITVPRETWGALREALEKSRSARTYSERIEAHECAVLALTAANAVSHQKPETTPAPEGGAITAGNGQAPYSNCRFRICDLPGQCKGEGKCHHPAVQQAQEPEGWNPNTTNPITPDRAHYFMRRFKKEEKLLGPNEQAAVDYVLAMLEAAPKQAEPRLPEFFAQYEYDAPNWDVVVSVYQRHPDKLPSLVHKQTLPAQQAEPAWQPIESAPKDGSEILLGHPDGSMAVGWWREARSHGRVAGWSDGDDFAITWPSHWKPKPAAPEAKQ